MSILDFFRFRQDSSATTAKERLQIVVSHQRADGSAPDFLPQLRQELMAVVSKYAKVDQEKIQVALQNEGDFSVLELNITVPSESI